MYIKLTHAMALSVVVSTIAVVAHWQLTASDDEPVPQVTPLPSHVSPQFVDVAAPLPLPALPPLAAPLVEPVRERVPLAELQCRRCDREREYFRLRPTLASETAMRVCLMKCGGEERRALKSKPEPQ